MFNDPKKSTALFCTGLALSIGVAGFLQSNPSTNQTQGIVNKNVSTTSQTRDLNVVNTKLNNELSNKNYDISDNSKESPIDISKAKVIKKHEEIKDLKLLFERAKKGKQEFSDADKFKAEAKIHKISAEANTFQVKNYQTSQLIEELENPDGTKIETYAITNFASAYETDTDGVLASTNNSGLNVTNLSNTNSSLAVRPMADKYDEQWDPTYGVKAYSRVYVTKTTDSRGTWLDLSSVNGGWLIDDSSYYLTNMRVRLVQIGVGTSGSVYKTADKYPGGSKFNYAADPAWPKVSANTSGAGKAYVGAGQYVKIHHGASAWQFDWSNNY
ncbi:hypothetical protein [Ectobacillus panaciterrae]|uniref:hypothetical protein n=1 Tax=Ectobacillus panaciterrae TaxID=363872 RepID=UPI000407F0CC|nr:hypothetical protein [Ectobacillus panaciterrae]